VARAEGFVPHTKVLMAPCGGAADVARYLMRCRINDNQDAQNNEE
jgi:hypothetical protein